MLLIKLAPLVSKYGITLNLNHPEGVAIAKRLVALSDVVIDSFTRRAMRKWGLYYDDLVQLKPDIIVVSAAQQGHTGPHADYLVATNFSSHCFD